MVPHTAYHLLLPAAFAFAHLAFAVAAIFALATALIFRLALVPFDFPLAFAHLALCAAAILALAAADILRSPFMTEPTAFVPKIRFSLFSSEAICFLILAAAFNCAADRFIIVFIRIMQAKDQKKSSLV
jgi:hypothetical protein